MSSKLLTVFGGGWRNVAQPVGFDMTLPFVVQTDGTRFRVWDTTHGHEWDPADYAPAATKTYYVRLDGNDGAAGTEAAPLATLAVAVAKADVDRVVCLDEGPYHLGASTAGVTLQRSMSIIGYGSGTVITGAYPALSWELDETYTNTWKVVQTDASKVAFDASNLDANGDLTQLTIQASAEDVNETPGSIYRDTGTNTLYVRTFDDREPDADIRISATNKLAIDIAGASKQLTVFLDNLKVYHARDALRANVGDVVYARDCEFAYVGDGASLGIGVYALGSKVLLRACRVHHVGEDGIDCSPTSAPYNYAESIEVDCVVHDTGISSSTDSHNCSTGHTGSLMCCVNGTYSRSKGRVIADIGASKRWMLGCSVSDPVPGNATYDNTIANGTDGDADLMWLDSCTLSGGAYDINTGTAGRVYVRRLTSGGQFTGTNPPESY